MSELTHETHYLHSIHRLGELLGKLTGDLQTVPGAIINAGLTLPRQGDSAESLMGWRTNVEELHALCVAAEAVKAEALLACNILARHVREVGLADVLFPQSPNGTN